MSKDLHGFESGGFTVLTHNVLDAFGEPGIIAVAEEVEVVELFRVRTVKGIGFLRFSSMSRQLIFTTAEFVSHEEDSLH